MKSVFGGFWKRAHLDVNLCFSFIEVKWGRRETSFYPSHTVKWMVVGKDMVFPWILGTLLCFSGIGF